MNAVDALAKAAAAAEGPLGNFIRIGKFSAAEVKIQIWLDDKPAAWIAMTAEQIDELVRILRTHRGELP